MQFILGFVFLLVFFYLLKNAMQSSKASYNKWLAKVTIILATGILLLLVVTGRIHVLAALGAALLVLIRQFPLIVKALPVLKKVFGQVSKYTQGQKSTLDTSLLEMTLDHDSGEMDGLVIEGSYQGQRLSQMSTAALADLHQVAVGHYPDSVEVLETYLARVYGEHWQEQFGVGSQPKRPAESGELSADEARDILGLQAGASEEEIILAHRKMMQKFHPDRGGSNYLAAKVNAAKDILLGELQKK
jgi:hypothetical protein